MKLMPLSLEAVDIFLRVLDALDEEVVQQDPSRSAADVARFMQIVCHCLYYIVFLFELSSSKYW
jgi:hypothetical protein